MTRLRFHRVAELFPMMDEAEISRLADDIRTNGQREAIWLHSDGSILDGRNRYRACEIVGAEPKTRTWNGKAGSEVAFVISLNLHRRHLNESQRAMVAARVATLEKGSNQHAPVGAPSQDEAADMLSVGRRTVQRAREVIEKATPELVAAVDSGAVSVSQATKIAKAEPAIQRRIVETSAKSGLSPVEAYRTVKAETIAKAEIAKPSGKYRVIYADPPWSYGNRMPPGTTEPRDHYPTMELEEICALPIKQLAQDDAVLFLWATSPLVPESLEVIKAWGFEYKASFVWDKIKHNMGHYNSVRHEFLWICTRGSCQPDVRKLHDSVVSVERTAHSRKPEAFYEIIEEIYPNGKRVELFARASRDGWDRWGLEANTNVA